MDCSSINVIDLRYNKSTEMMKIYKKDEVEPDIISEKLDFYKIRIFNMAKKFYKKEVDKKIKYSFLDFANIIQHFKFIDASEAIQRL